MKLSLDFSLHRGSFHLAARGDFPLQGITALFGPSGCGKTSFLRALAGLEKGRGSISLGDSVWQNKEKFLVPHRRHLGVIFQETDLFPHLSVEQNLLFGYKRTPASLRSLNPTDIISFLKLETLLGRRPHNLSGGERQRVALGRALLASPQILLMDEPLSALDQAAKLEIYPYLRHIAQAMNIPIIYVSHILDEVARLTDQMILMESGEIVAFGETATMLTRLDLPLARHEEAEAVILGTVQGHDAAWQLTRIEFAGGSFIAPRFAANAGDSVRLRVAASDVSITLERPASSSIQNIFPARITEIAEGDIPLALLKLDLSGTPLLARITRKSLSALGLRVGSEVFAQVKGAAVLV